MSFPLVTGFFTNCVFRSVGNNAFGGCFTPAQSDITHNFGGNASFHMVRTNFNNHDNYSGSNNPVSTEVKFMVRY